MQLKPAPFHKGLAITREWPSKALAAAAHREGASVAGRAPSTSLRAASAGVPTPADPTDFLLQYRGAGN